MSVNVILHEVQNASKAEGEFLRESVGLLRKALQMPGFGASVRQANYDATAYKGLHGAVQNLDGDAIWTRIVEGRECGKTADHTIDLAVTVMDRAPGPDTSAMVIGATRLGTLPILTARWFLERCMASGDRVNLAAHLMHQWMHVSGFVHLADCAGQRDVPAVLSDLVRRSLENDHGDEIAKDLTTLLMQNVGCNCQIAETDAIA